MPKQLLKVFRESASIEEAAFQGCSFDTNLNGTGCDEALTCCMESAKFQIRAGLHAGGGNDVGRRLIRTWFGRSSRPDPRFATLKELNVDGRKPMTRVTAHRNKQNE